MKKIVGKLCLVALPLAWIICIFSWLVIVPSISQSALPHATKYYASEPAYVLQMNTSEAIWSDSMDIEITFGLAAKAQDYNVTPSFFFDFARAFVGREAMINYTYICNDQVAHQMRHSTSEGSCRTYGGYDNKPIDSNILRSGSNKIVLRVSISSWSVIDQPKRGFLHLEIKDVFVDVNFIDEDADGLFNAVDPMVNSDNYVVAATSSIAGMPIAAYIGLILSRRLEK